jgi:hypothetical protein
LGIYAEVESDSKMRIIQIEEAPIIEPGDMDRRVAKITIHPEMYETIKQGSGKMVIKTNDTANDAKYVEVILIFVFLMIA